MLKVKSYAKINLFLEILKKRNDGFHDIETVFQLIDLFDEMTFTLTNNPSIKILTSEESLNNKENIIYKIAIFLKRKFSVSNGVEIFLKKNIPIAAGLGGGSSNCAITLMTLNKLWNLKLSNAEIHSIAADFGSDINFFLEGKTAKGRSRGEKLEEIDYQLFNHILLINPNFPISSGEAYNLVEIPNQPIRWNFQDVKNLFNRLELGIRKKYPKIEEIISQTYKFGPLKTILSGSGPTIISFFENEKLAKKAEKYFKSKEYWTKITKTINQ